MGMRLLIIISHLNTGGAQTQVRHIAEYMARRGHRVSVVFFDEDLKGTPEFKGVKTHHLPRKGRFSPLLLWRIVQLIHREGIDVVVSLLFPSNVYAAMAGWISCKPVMTSERSIYPYGKWRKRIIRFYCRRSYAVIANCQATRKALISSVGLPSHKIVVLYNGVPLRHYVEEKTSPCGDADWATDPGVCKIGVVANFVPAKNYLGMLEGIRLVRQRNARIKVLVAGEGPLESDIRATIRKDGLEDTVHFLGLLTDPTGLYQSVDFLVLFSHREGFSNVVVEALATGCPVVATRVGGTPEIVHNNHNGCLVDPGDSNALADVICRWAQMKTYRDMKENCVSSVRKLDMESVITDWERLLKQAISRRPLATFGASVTLERVT